MNNLQRIAHELGRTPLIQCSACEEYKHPDKFDKSSKNKRGRASQCKECRKARKRKSTYVKIHPNNTRCKPGYRHCPGCKKSRPKELFYFWPAQGTYGAYCRPCKNKRDRKRRAAQRKLKGAK